MERPAWIRTPPLQGISVRSSRRPVAGLSPAYRRSIDGYARDRGVMLSGRRPGVGLMREERDKEGPQHHRAPQQHRYSREKRRRGSETVRPAGLAHPHAEQRMNRPSGLVVRASQVSAMPRHAGRNHDGQREVNRRDADDREREPTLDSVGSQVHGPSVIPPCPASRPASARADCSARTLLQVLRPVYRSLLTPATPKPIGVSVHGTAAPEQACDARPPMLPRTTGKFEECPGSASSLPAGLPQSNDRLSTGSPATASPLRRHARATVPWLHLRSHPILCVGPRPRMTEDAPIRPVPAGSHARWGSSGSRTVRRVSPHAAVC